MKKTITITISRQFGSNGREIGRKLAEYLDIGYYNKEIMEKIAKDMGVSSDFFNEDNQNEDGLYSISNRKLRSFGSIAELSVNSQVFERATDLICGIFRDSLHDIKSIKKPGIKLIDPVFLYFKAFVFNILILKSSFKCSKSCFFIIESSNYFYNFIRTHF